MNPHFAAVLAKEWLCETTSDKRLRQHLFPLGISVPELSPGCAVHVKLRAPAGSLHLDDTAIIHHIRDEAYIRSTVLSEYALHLSSDVEYLVLFFEASPTAARCTVAVADKVLFDILETAEPPIRLHVYDLPPNAATLVDAEDVYRAIYDSLSGGDRELFGTNAEEFLSTPHILVPLFSHTMSLSSEENIDFPLVLRTTAEQLRLLLTDESTGFVRIKKIERNHAQLWSSVLGERIAFADGGVARISGLAGSEPLALRVGIFSVRPGETNLDEREEWRLTPYVMGDLTTDLEGQQGHRPDPKRLQEAARYVLEPLTALDYLERRPDVRYMFTHGPLVNQFTQYDEGEPNWLPALKEGFLQRHGLNENDVIANISGIPKTHSGRLLWNQFMAVYGALMIKVFSCNVPFCGVVERTAGKWLTTAVLDLLVAEKRITQVVRSRILKVIERFEISDDFLFGCVLEEGEYLDPMPISKSETRRARDPWKEVVRQYPSPFATVLKTSATNFPYRVEMNPAALKDLHHVLTLLYHTSRLLPRYAFPVGLDIVDKYAKVPDWLSRGISARIAADVLARALRTGDPNTVAQVRQFLAHTPRDFFYRPQA